MIYKAENIDTDKFLKHLNFLEEFDRQKEIEERIAVEKYHEGYIRALYTVKEMFYCSNYEKKGEKYVSN